MNSKKLILKLGVIALGLATLHMTATPAKPLQFASLTFATPHPAVIAVMLPEKSVASAMGTTDLRCPIAKSVAVFK